VATLIIDASETPKERASLQRVAAGLTKAADLVETQARRREGIGDRVSFAEIYERQLLSENMKPDSVSATGNAEKTVLRVRGWFCTRQFIFSFENDAIADQVRRLGFTRLECSSAFQSWWQDF
jgi:hypothetical protein